MPDITTSIGGDGGRRGRRPILHPGEVTKKKHNAAIKDSVNTEEPPPPTGNKIGGARNFLKNTEATVVTNDVGGPDGSLSDIVTLEPPPKRSRIESEACTPNSEYQLMRVEAAPPGWRTLWARTAKSWKDHPKISIRQVCWGGSKAGEPWVCATRSDRVAVHDVGLHRVRKKMSVLDFLSNPSFRGSKLLKGGRSYHTRNFQLVAGCAEDSIAYRCKNGDCATPRSTLAQFQQVARIRHNTSKYGATRGYVQTSCGENKA